MKIEIVTVGDELLLGFTIDTNAAHLARELAAIGVEVTRRASVGDNASDIAAAVREALDRTGAVITTGGLGPTADDLTKPAIGELFGLEMHLDESIVESMKARWAALKRTGPFPESNVAQAMIPAGAVILPNRHGSAPGIWIEDDRGRWVAMLPGVPREMRGLFADELLPRLAQRNLERDSPATVIRSRTLRTTGIAESALADLLGDLARGVNGMGVAFLPAVHSVDLRVTARGMVAEEADAKLGDAILKLRAAAERYVYGEQDDDLAAIVLSGLKSRGLRLAVAESCTGGMLGSRLTAVPGSSEAFLGGIIAYDNAVKRELLGISDDILAEHGSVSGEVAAAMALAVQRMLSADIGVGITGVAGPGGGTAAKPVGMVWVAIAGMAERSVCLRLFGTREEIRERAAQSALEMVRRTITTG